MNEMSCEACGSNELTKKGEFFVCDYCQTSYQSPKVPEEKPATTIYNKTTIIKQHNEESPHNSNQPVKSTSFIKRILSIPFMLIGSILLLVAIASLQNFDVYGIILFGWWSISMLNLSFTMATGKKVLLTKKFNGWQLAMITILVFFALLVLI